MKRSIAIFLLLLLAAWAMLPARELPRGWFLEGAAAFAWLAPGDLNARFEAQQRRTDFLYRQGYEAQQRTSGGAFSYTLEEPRGSGLQGLHGVFPVALRIGRALGARVAIFAGLQFLESRKTSWLQQTHRVHDLRPDQVTPPESVVTEIDFPDCSLSARAWIPQLGVMIDLFGRRSWKAGVRLAAGPMFASLRTIEAQHFRRTEADGYWTEWRYVYDMKGKGTGAAVEAAVRLSWPVSSRIGLHLEGGYALRVGSSFSGPGSYAYQYRDANAARDPIRSQWQDGEWRTRRLGLQQPWGSLAYTLSGNDLAGTTDAGKFRLDLSGCQLAIGLAVFL
jgi:hypothetical protein